MNVGGVVGKEYRTAPLLNIKIVKKALTNISNFCIIAYEIGKSRSVALSSLAFTLIIALSIVISKQ